MLVIFINDLPYAAKCEVNTALYADDSKIFGAVKCACDCCIVHSIEYGRMGPRVVTTSNLTPLNQSKLTVTHKKQPFTYDYSLDNAQLKYVAERGGPWNHHSTSTLSLDKHVNAIVPKTNRLHAWTPKAYLSTINKCVSQEIISVPC